MKTPRQMKEFFILAFDSDRSVCTAAIYYSGPISTVPTKEQLLSEERTGGKFHIDSLKTEGLVRICTHSHTGMAKSTQLVTLIIYIYTYIYFIGSPTFPSGCYKLRGKLNIPCSEYKN